MFLTLLFHYSIARYQNVNRQTIDHGEEKGQYKNEQCACISFTFSLFFLHFVGSIYFFHYIKAMPISVKFLPSKHVVVNESRLSFSPSEHNVNDRKIRRLSNEQILSDCILFKQLLLTFKINTISIHKKKVRYSK